ncbi:MAG: carboxylating nicotinate-nucleotide diphosphorylase [Hydrogenothermaceae bacterium]|nr:carboxylating nicotinate-nucleotide diphosphorylase [Hydrogenothermaceae bacterium]
MIDKLFLRKKIEEFLEEDIGYCDITTDSLDLSKDVKAVFVAKESLVVAGLDFALEVFNVIDGNVKFEKFKEEGQKVEKGEILASVEGNGKSILKGERLALNILQRLSGIATNTKMYVEALSGSNSYILDTRKTTPGFRAFEKYAVRVGGGKNHRFALYDMVMLKDNHIKMAGSIKEAVKQVKNKVSPMVKIEVEVSNFEEFKEAVDLEVDIIMLDNMSLEEIREAVKINNGKKKLEVSGNVTLENIRKYAETGVDFISSGALIHSARWVDISLKFID